MYYYILLLDSDDEVTMKSKMLKRFSTFEQKEFLEVDDWCHARWNGGNQWFPGVITAVYGLEEMDKNLEEFTYDILYDECEDEYGDTILKSDGVPHQDVEFVVPAIRVVYYSTKKKPTKKGKKKRKKRRIE